MTNEETTTADKAAKKATGPRVESKGAKILATKNDAGDRVYKIAK